MKTECLVFFTSSHVFPKLCPPDDASEHRRDSGETAKQGKLQGLLGGTPQACKLCARPAARLKPQEPGDSDRDVRGLMDRGSYTSEVKTALEQHPPWTAGRTRQQASLPGEEGGHQLQGETRSGWLTGYQGNQQGATPVIPPVVHNAGGDVLI